MIDEHTTQIILGATVAIVSGSSVWAIFKRKLSQIRSLIDDADDMVQDNTVTEAEFQKFWADLRALILPDKKVIGGT